MSTLIVGCGYLGNRVGEWLARRGEQVHGTVRSPERAEELCRRGISPIIADVLKPESLESLPAVERVLYCVGFDRSSGAAMRTVYVDGLHSLLDHLPVSVGRLVYASSTSVYGHTEGEWVDESSSTEPASESGKICLDAERLLGNWRNSDVGPVILRFSGLYGPDRMIRRSSLERGELIAGDPNRFLNLVHIDDAAQAAVAALDALAPASVYVVSDDRPVLRREYYSLAARMLGAPPPRFNAQEPTRPDSGRDTVNRRMLNRRMRDHLGVDLIYPDITSGLPAALAVQPISTRGARPHSAGSI